MAPVHMHASVYLARMLCAMLAAMLLMVVGSAEQSFFMEH